MGKEKKDKKDKKSKEKKSKKDKKDKKNSKKDRKRDRDSSSSSSSSDDEGLTPAQQLKQERAAVAAMRELLWHHQAARKELRELLWTVDQGKAANIGGVPDLVLRERLRNVLQLLQLKKAGSKDVLALPKGAPTTLSIIGFVFDEAPRPPPQPAPKPAVRGPERPPAAAVQQDTSDQGREGETGAGAGADAAPGSRGASEPAAGGAAGSSSPGPSSPSSSSEGGSPAADREGSAGAGGAGGGGARRVVGPAMPSAEMLAAAAAAAAAAPSGEEESEEGDAGPGVRLDEESLDDMMVGPPPPDLVDEVDALPEDAREAEVVRIMRVIRDARNAHESARASALTAPKPGEAAPAPDAYDVLGVPHDAPAGDIKKRYMRLSLLIHPDKCAHADAHTAFQAVAVAAKALQDAGARSALDAAREDRRLRQMAERAAAAEEQARQWRVARGEEAPGAPITAGLERPTREAWMTELPPEKQRDLMGELMNQQSQRSFSRFGVKARGDTSEWTDTPAERAARAANGGLMPGAAGPLLIKGSAEAGGPSAGDTVDAKIMDVYNAQARKKTLLEQHLEAQGKGRGGSGEEPKAKKAKTDKGEKERSKDKSKDKDRHKDRDKDKDKGKAGPSLPGAAGGDDDKSWVGKHPWRPFDRDKDLELAPKALDPKKILAQQQGVLGSKFQSAGGTRHFL